MLNTNDRKKLTKLATDLTKGEEVRIERFSDNSYRIQTFKHDAAHSIVQYVQRGATLAEALSARPILYGA